MKVFISWSGDKSRSVALAISDWLPQVINSVDPFVSSKDIDAGARWQGEVAAQLEATNFGIVCVTRENQLAPWLNFEAGALAKAVDSSRVVPLAVDLKPSDIKPPLGQFQAKPATEEGMRAIVESVNAASDDPLNQDRLQRALSKWWPDLETALQTIEEASVVGSTSDTPARSDRELLEEVLNIVRSSSVAPSPNLPPQRGLPPIGALVRHAEFGKGVVMKSNPRGRVVLRFDDGSIHSVMWNSAPIEMLLGHGLDDKDEDKDGA